MLICIYILINKVYFLSECLLHWYIIYLKIFLFCMSFCAPSANLFFISIDSLYYFFFHLPRRLPILFLAFPCPACFLDLPISSPDAFSVPFLALPTSVPCLFHLLMPFFLCILPVSLPCLLLCPAFFLALPTSVSCLFPCPAYFLSLPISVPCLFPCPAYFRALPISLTY